MRRPSGAILSRHLSSRKARSAKGPILVSKVLFMSVLLLLAGSAGALAHLHLTDDPSPQDPPITRPQADGQDPCPTADINGDTDMREYLWVDSSARMGRTRGRTIPSSTALRRNKDAFEADGSLTVELSRTNGPATAYNLDVDPIFSSDGRIVVAEKGAHDLKEAKAAIERTHRDTDHHTLDLGMEVDSCSDHRLSHDGYGWECHMIHSG